MIKIATVFSGIGAPEEALRQMKVDFETVFACDNGERELEKSYEEIIEDTKDFSYEDRIEYVNQLYDETHKINYVKASYLANHDLSNGEWYEDVRFIDGNRYQDQVDILIGGSPCQSFSTYGKKQGFEDTRGTLFFHYANLIKDMKPKAFVYENVIGLKSHDSGNTWKRIQEVFKDLEYDTHVFELNAMNYGLPQNRLRIFVVGFRKDLNIKEFAAPKEKKLRKKASSYLSKNVNIKYYLGQKGFEWATTPAKHQGRTRVNRDVIGCQTANQQFNWTGDLRLETPTEEHRNNPNIYIGMYNGEEKVARKMTPRECLRLMGFKKFKIVVDDKNIYRQSGNSIAVPVLQALFKRILEETNNFNENNRQ